MSRPLIQITLITACGATQEVYWDKTDLPPIFRVALRPSTYHFPFLVTDEHSIDSICKIEIREFRRVSTLKYEEIL